MGLFGKSESERNIETLQNTVLQINYHLSQTERSLIANNGPNSSNINFLIEHHDELYRLQKEMESLLNRIPQQEHYNIKVQWTDGRYFPFYMWLMSYNDATAKLEYAIKIYNG